MSVPTPAPVPPPTPLTRAQYLQIRAQIRTLTAAAKSLPLATFVATIEQAEKDGPVQNPKMWTEGAGQLAKDKVLANTVATLAKST
jgi:hypothetical protein